ncbi:MAG: chromosomal replication initiator protein DnaA [Thermovirgaceae bacterium]|nr:chromosomal replication initiator protein DnaA [Synergistales bacterium]MDI9392986.1 chromosomal replication initiator protein DnaA [Synergistota bacterium]MDY0178506.1 chromosomal replication initiator protein DnaA [Synergistaceae bacterium]HRW86974.1 chromosomal replication initiator protein DnaA [Thermovirgaceae bacterium]MDD3133173.1 chromosomal replication initiator protein DnaA [Synergistales bacterium]
MEDNTAQVWRKILEIAEDNLPKGAADIWLKTCLPVSLVDQVLTLDVPNVFVREQIQSRFIEKLTALTSQKGLADRIVLEVGGAKKEEIKRAERISRESERPKNGLNPDYQFDSFVVGKSNRLAHAASLAVAESPGVAYNPLFFWGGVGLGKTHLLHAIGNFVTRHNEGTKIAYISSEKFINEFIMSIQNNKTHEFKLKYRSVDVLLIDDIHFLANKESTQEEFFHTFNSLHDAKKQIVLTSDKPPKDIHNIEERLVSRFEWGLVTDIQPPDLETRIAILKKKAALKNYFVPDDVIDFLAQNIPSNIRELEGSLNSVMFFADLNNESVTVDNASRWLKDLIRRSSRGQITIELIQQVTAESFGIPVSSLSGNKRTSEIALARQVAMYLSRDMTGTTLQQIGYAFNRKDHTTVIHACKKIEESLRKDSRIKSIVENLREKL